MNDKKTHRIKPQIFSDLEKIVRVATPRQIITGKQYLYFSLHPTQEDIQPKLIKKEGLVHCYALHNPQKIVVGYCVHYKGKPQLKILPEFGAAIFYTKNKKYIKKPKLANDEKFRLIAFDGKDYFVSVKWKSTNPTGD